MLTFYSKP